MWSYFVFLSKQLVLAELGLFGCDMCFSLCFYRVSLVRHDQISRDGKDLVHEMSFVYKAAAQDARRKTPWNVSCMCLKKLWRLEGFGTHTGCSFQSFTSSAVRPASKMSRLTRDTLPVDYRQNTFHIRDLAMEQSQQIDKSKISDSSPQPPVLWRQIKHVELLAHIKITTNI